jgi:NTP pyrophosphatase (non-canonical NTP hydrolase)
MTLNDYQDQAQAFNIVEDSARSEHAFAGLVEEVGELASHRKRKARGDARPDSINFIKKELGDILWYVADLCAVYGFSLEEVASANLYKLKKRKENDTIKGRGDER